MTSDSPPPEVLQRPFPQAADELSHCGLGQAKSLKLNDFVAFEGFKTFDSEFGSVGESDIAESGWITLKNDSN